MSDLRSRVAAAIDRGFNSSSDLNDYEAETQAMAQSVIDEFGLTEEAHPNKYLSDTRVVGEWEKHPNHTTHHLKCGCV